MLRAFPSSTKGFWWDTWVLVQKIESQPFIRVGGLEKLKASGRFRAEGREFVITEDSELREKRKRGSFLVILGRRLNERLFQDFSKNAVDL